MNCFGRDNTSHLVECYYTITTLTWDFEVCAAAEAAALRSTWAKKMLQPYPVTVRFIDGLNEGNAMMISLISYRSDKLS